jgi:hypothetical protein
MIMFLSKARLPIILWFVLLAAAVPLLHLATNVKPADPLPPDWQLPETIGDWQGERLYYSTDPEVKRAFREADIIQPGVCPVSGTPLDTVSVAERRLLPADVEIDRRLYHEEGGDVYRHVIMLVTGASREGIHRPEWCLAAQGVRIGTLRYVAATDTQGERFDVAVYPTFPRQAPETARPEQFFVYWFEGPDAHTPYNWVRILRMGWDRLWYGKVQRWAYFSIQLNLPPGTTDADAYIAKTVAWLLKGRAGVVPPEV